MLYDGGTTMTEEKKVNCPECAWHVHSCGNCVVACNYNPYFTVRVNVHVGGSSQHQCNHRKELENRLKKMGMKGHDLKSTMEHASDLTRGVPCAVLNKDGHCPYQLNIYDPNYKDKK